MFARLLRIQLKVDRIDEAVRLFKTNVVPQCKKQKGFKGAYFMVEPKLGDGLVITLWTSEEAMLANERSHFFLEQVTKLLGYFTKAPIREAYEVAVRDSKGKG
jgi:heme-degrading monooxygenase HmoA